MDKIVRHPHFKQHTCLRRGISGRSTSRVMPMSMSFSTCLESGTSAVRASCASSWNATTLSTSSCRTKRQWTPLLPFLASLISSMSHVLNYHMYTHTYTNYKMCAVFSKTVHTQPKPDYSAQCNTQWEGIHLSLFARVVIIPGAPLDQYTIQVSLPPLVNLNILRWSPGLLLKGPSRFLQNQQQKELGEGEGLSFS